MNILASSIVEKHKTCVENNNSKKLTVLFIRALDGGIGVCTIECMLKKKKSCALHLFLLLIDWPS